MGRLVMPKKAKPTNMYQTMPISPADSLFVDMAVVLITLRVARTSVFDSAAHTIALYYKTYYRSVLRSRGV